MTRLARVRAFATTMRNAMTPSARAWHGAAIAIYLLAAATAVFFFAVFFLQDFAWQKLPAFFTQVASLVLAGALALLLLALLNRIPSGYRIALFVFAPFAALSLAMGNEVNSMIFAAVLILLVSFIGAGVAVIHADGFRPGTQKVTLCILTLGLAGMAGGLYAIFSAKDIANPALDGYSLADRTIDLPNPGSPGAYDVLTLNYGSGHQQPRPMFGEDVDLVSRTVDGSKMIDNWDGLSGWLRTSYWGFDATQLPLQARVWYPDGDGPFPLVLVVHGNHSMEDFSDPGYAYLGELFASRGIILASVDENFVNSSISARVNVIADRPGLEEENDARGWLLLQHLAQWRDWNAEPGHAFNGKVDMERLALIGHSRGGEAVGIAAAFNSLDRYPDDATLDFDFNFNLRGVIAIAPVYGQYQPRERYTPIRDVNYFTIHGDMDGDVQSFEGMAQYSRVSFSGDEFRFRSGLYVVGANHGQFNTTWGNKDTSLFRAWALDLDGLMDGELQRDVARVYFGAFFEIVFNDRKDYLPIFRDARKAAAWLPDTFYINQFSSTEDRVLAGFEEDIDPGSGTLAGSRILTGNLSKWYETANELKYDELDTHSLVIAWDQEFSADVARVDFTLPGGGLGDVSNAVLVASLSAANTGTMPSDWEVDNDKEDDQPPAVKDDDADSKLLDWTIELTDAAGNTATLPLSHDSMLYPQINALPRRAGFLDSAEPSEVLFRRFELPLDQFVATSPRFEQASIARISFIFDRSTKGAVIMDDLSITYIH